METLRILIADDHEAVRRGIRALLETQGRWEITGEVRDGKAAVDRARAHKPHVVLLDLTMPEMNGLDAAREIRRTLPSTHVVLLTMHESEQLIDEACRAGAVSVISKATAHESLIPTIHALAASSAPVHLGGSIIGRRHIGAFFTSHEERHRLLGPFIGDGLAQNDKALHIIDPPDRDDHVRRLAEMHIDVDGAEARGQLELVPWEETYLLDGVFDLHRMARLVRWRFYEAAARGFRLTRLVAHMEWALRDLPGVRELIEYEARFNHDVAESRDIVVCAYDLTQFPPALMAEAMRAHPALLIDGALIENAHYAAPEMIDAFARRPS